MTFKKMKPSQQNQVLVAILQHLAPDIDFEFEASKVMTSVDGSGGLAYIGDLPAGVVEFDQRDEPDTEVVEPVDSEPVNEVVEPEPAPVEDLSHLRYNGRGRSPQPALARSHKPGSVSIGDMSREDLDSYYENTIMKSKEWRS